MLNDKTFLPTLIDAGHAVRIDDGEGTEICSLQGIIWITQAGDQRDIILHAGESFRLDRDGLALLVALEGPATARIVDLLDQTALDSLATAGVLADCACGQPATHALGA